VRRKHPKLELWVRVAWAFIVPGTTLVFRRRWRGIEHIPESGPVIVAVNHVSYADPALVARYLYDAGRVPRFLVKSSAFKVRLFGSVLRGASQIPVYRGTADATDALRDAIAALDRGECLVFYPEGTVTRDPQFWPMLARTGVARVALESGAPVIPLAQWGAQDAVDFYARKFRLLPPRKVVTLMAGPAVDLSAYRGRPMTATVLRQATDTIMRAICGLLAEIRAEQPPAEFFRPSAKAEGPGPTSPRQESA
jgi:1-acyl-sn-glycerol-3-phosphate acyltransferase